MAGMMEQLVDCHCHAHDHRDEWPALGRLQCGTVALMGVNEANWELMEEAAAGSTAATQFILAYGVHPWFAHTLSAENEAEGHKEEDRRAEEEPRWALRLREKLVANPKALVGEIGLDKVARSRGGKGTKKEMWQGQEATFARQLRLAAELERPVSMHCVRATGGFYEYLKREVKAGAAMPPAIALHSYGGSPDMVLAFTKLPVVGARIYFGFSAVINVRCNGRDAVAANVRQCPPDRILLETDLDAADGLDDSLVQIYELVAEARGWSLEETVAQVGRNSREFFGPCWPDDA